MDSIAKPKEIVARVKELGQSAVAVTDHGTTSGLIETYTECQQQGVKMIFGCEHYYCADVTIKERGYRHINFWTATQEGYRNLLKLTSQAHNNFYYKPRVDLDLIRKYNAGLLMSSACLGGWIRNEDNTVNRHLLDQFMKIFEDRLYIEIHTYSSDEQKEWNMKLVEIAREYGLPMVAACDSHYVRREDAPVHKAWLTQGKEREDGYYNTPDFFIHSESEMREALAYLPLGVVEECICNTQVIADRCNVEIAFGEMHYPTVNVKDEELAVREIMRANWKRKIPKEYWKEYAERINKEEMPVLDKAGYFQYFLITHDFVSWCRQAGIPMGYSRGSVGGCLTAYAMDLIQTDAIKYDLNFARFCHLERVTPADIDIDVSQKRRGEAIEYLRQKYGEDRIFKARTYGYMKARGALRRAGNTLDYNPQDVNGWSKSIPDFTDDEYKGEEHERFLIDQTDAPDDLKTLAKAFVGILQSFGAHASAILIFPDEPENYTAIEKGKESPVCAYEFHTLESLGCLKLDVLGIKTTDVIAETIRLAGISIDTANLPLDDTATFDMLCSGKTGGVFQIEGSGFTNLVKQIQPRHFDDLAPLLAVFRPGIIGAGLLDTYIKRKRGEESVEYLIPELEPILQNTVGIIVFQEQIIEVAKKICGYTAAQADMLRRAIGRKKPEDMEKIKPDFIVRAVEHGQPEEKAIALFELIEFFAAYGFNKCLSGRERIQRNISSNKNPFTPTIAEMYKIKNSYKFARETGHCSLHTKYKKYGYGYALSMGGGNRIRKNKIVDITYSGAMPVYLVTTDTGKEARCTMNHKLPTPSGIKMLSEISVGDYLYVKGTYEPNTKKYNFGTQGSDNFPQKSQCGFRKKPNGNSVIFEMTRKIMESQSAPCEKCGAVYNEFTRFELHHVDMDRSNNDSSNLVWLCNSCHKKVRYALGRTRQYEKGIPVVTEKVISIKYECTEDCYDVEMEAPAHNFTVASGIVVCNSHAYGYCMLSYATAYLKAHHPREFMCALINSEGSQEDIVPYITECKRMGITVLPPDVTVGNTEWAVEGNDLRMGLTYVKGVGGNLTLADSFVAFRSANNKGVVTALIKAGALDAFGDRMELLKVATIGDNKKDLLQKQEADMQRIGELEVDLANIKPELKKYATTKQQITNRKTAITKRVKKITEVEAVEKQIEKNDNAIGEMEVLGMSFAKLPKVQQGVVKKLFTKNDKKDREMAWITFVSDYGEQKCVCFAYQWKQWKKILNEGAKVWFYIEEGVLKDVKS